MSEPNNIRIIGAPMDLGQQRRGVDMGPSAIRYAGLQTRLCALGLRVTDGGNVDVPIVETLDPTDDSTHAHNMQAVGEVCRLIHARVKASIAAGETVITLGGDHSVSLGSISAALTRPERVGVLWIDAHGDYNTPETTPSGNVHGMVVAALSGLCPPMLTIGDTYLQPDQIVMLGIRDLDAAEKRALAGSGIKVITMREIDERGVAASAREALNTLRACDVLHVSLDLDSLDPMIAPGVGTPVPGGLTYREAHLLMEILADDGRVRSLDIVEVNTILDERNSTARLAVELAASLFGQRIL